MMFQMYKDLLSQFNINISMYRLKQHEETIGHQVRVGSVVNLITKHLGYDKQTSNDVSAFARLHDIGKMYLCKDVLYCKSELPSHDIQALHTHTQVGYEVVKEATKDLDISPVDKSRLLDIILNHHCAEYCMASGIVRIVTVADCFDAMMYGRCYKTALGLDKTIDELEKYSGTRYDKEVVDALLEIIEKDHRLKDIYNH